MLPSTVSSVEDKSIDELLERLRQGDKTAMDELLAVLFQDLRRLARSQRLRMGGGETLCTTALVHEAYLKMRRSTSVSVQSRRHFLRTAGMAMRQILIDHARSQLAAQDRDRIAGSRHEGSQLEIQQQARRVLDINVALEDLEATNERLASVVTYRYFGGFSEAEIADILDVSERTVRRDWFKAKALLAQALASTRNSRA